MAKFKIPKVQPPYFPKVDYILIDGKYFYNGIDYIITTENTIMFRDMIFKFEGKEYEDD